VKAIGVLPSWAAFVCRSELSPPCVEVEHEFSHSGCRPAPRRRPAWRPTQQRQCSSETLSRPATPSGSSTGPNNRAVRSVLTRIEVARRDRHCQSARTWRGSERQASANVDQRSSSPTRRRAQLLSTHTGVGPPGASADTSSLPNAATLLLESAFLRDLRLRNPFPYNSTLRMLHSDGVKTRKGRLDGRV